MRRPAEGFASGRIIAYIQDEAKLPAITACPVCSVEGSFRALCQGFDGDIELAVMAYNGGPGSDTSPASTTTSYVYDSNGSRLKRIVTTTTTTLYVAGMEIELVNGTESKRTIYYPMGGAFRVYGG